MIGAHNFFQMETSLSQGQPQEICFIYALSFLKWDAVGCWHSMLLALENISRQKPLIFQVTGCFALGTPSLSSQIPNTLCSRTASS